MLYHINPETGRPNKCTATKRACPLGGRHFETKDEARSYYEEARKDVVMKTLRKRRDSDPNEESEDSQEMIHTYPASCRGEVEKAIEKANRRLERFGISERFEYDVEEFVQTVKRDGLRDVHEERIRITLKSPSISYGDHKFLAVIENAGGQKIVKSAHDAELGGWKPKDMHCDHCGQNRERGRTYLVEDYNGSIKQIGSSCVHGYLGVKPEGLWSIGTDPIENLQTRGQSTYVESTDEMLAAAAVLSNDGKSYVSRSQAMYGDSVATSDQISFIYSNNKVTPEEATERERLRNEVKDYMESGKAKKIREDIRNLDGKNDWEGNVKSIAENDYISPRNVSLLTSGILAVRKRDEFKKKEPIPKSVGHWGNPKDSVKGKKAKVEKIRYFQGINQYNGRSETRAQVTFRDSENKIGIWWTTSDVDEDMEGSDVELTGGSIKKYSQYRDDDQTVITRVKFKKSDESSD